MKRLTIGMATIGLGAACLLFAGIAQIQAGTILIDFEQFGDETNLHGVNLGGVTLTNPSGRVEIHENRFGVSSRSGSKAIASPDGLVSVNPLVGIFDTPVNSMSLWGGDAGTYAETDSWELLAFDARVGGNLVGRVSSGSWNGGPYRQLSLSAAEIWRFHAVWTGPEFGIGYDDLRFTTVPPPPPPPPESDPSNGSFDGGSDLDVLSIDFGELLVGSTATAIPFELWNLPSVGPTADLNLVDFSGSGDTGVFLTSLSPFTDLSASSSRSFEAAINTSEPGEFNAEYSLFVSDETGLSQVPLTISIRGSVVPEPSTFLLTAVGLLSLIAWGWWRRKTG